jgi:hypothetical protein
MGNTDEHDVHSTVFHSISLFYLLFRSLGLVSYHFSESRSFFTSFIVRISQPEFPDTLYCFFSNPCIFSYLPGTVGPKVISGLSSFHMLATCFHGFGFIARYFAIRCFFAIVNLNFSTISSLSLFGVVSSY